MDPITRKETFLAKAGGQDVTTPTPVTREEYFLNEIANGGGGGLPTPENDGLILFSDNGNWIQQEIRNIYSHIQEIWVNFDGQGFSVDTTKTSTSDLSPSKYMRTSFTCIYVSLDGDIVYLFPAHLSLTNGLSQATYQTSIVTLDSIGLDGNVGYLWVDINSEGNIYAGLNYWPATSM